MRAILVFGPVPPLREAGLAGWGDGRRVGGSERGRRANWVINAQVVVLLIVVLDLATVLKAEWEEAKGRENILNFLHNMELTILA